MSFVASKVEKEELEAKIASMRILENVDLPASIQAMIPPKPVKPVKEKVTKATTTTEAASAVIKTVVKAASDVIKTVIEAASDEKTAVEDEEEEVEVVPKKPAPTVRMANLCCIAGHKVNGVAAIHSEIVKEEVFNDFYKVCVHPKAPLGPHWSRSYWEPLIRFILFVFSPTLVICSTDIYI